MQQESSLRKKNLSSMDLTVFDFNDEDMYLKYYFLVMGLMDYACAIICGDEGSGKTLLQAWLTYQVLRLFPEKRGTLDWSPPHKIVTLTDIGRASVLEGYEGEVLDCLKNNGKMYMGNLLEYLNVAPEYLENKLIPKLQEYGAIGLEQVDEFKRCDFLLDEKMVSKLKDEVNEMAKFPIKPPPEILRTLLVYNRVFGLDECDSYGDKGYRTNLTRLIGKIITRRRHFHTSMFMVFVDQNTADKRYIWNRRTHLIKCANAGDRCSYWIWNMRSKKGRQLELTPSKWGMIWDTHNVVPITHDVQVDLGSSRGKKIKKDKPEAN